MYRFHRCVIALLAAGLPLIMGGCNWPWEQGAGQRHGEITLTLGHSPSEAATRPTIEQCARATIAYAAKEGAVLHVAPVAVTADMQWTTIDFHLHGSREETNHKVAQDAQQAHSTEALRAIRSILTGTIPTDSSDQVNALAQAGRILAGASEPKLAVICADGHTVSHELNIYRQRLDPAGARSAIAAVHGELVEMHGVDVYWGDAGGDRNVNVSGNREAQIARFWTETWARAVHAKSVSYQQTVKLPA